MIPFTPRAKRTLEKSRREAQERGPGQIQTEHILLSLVRETRASQREFWT